MLTHSHARTHALPLAFHIIFHMRLSLALIIIFIKLLLLLLLPARSLPGVFCSFFLFAWRMLSRSRRFYLRDVYETCSANYELLSLAPSLSGESSETSFRLLRLTFAPLLL